MTEPAPDRPIRVLFVCTGNSARSQIAEGLARVLGAGRIEALSAGTNPIGLNPLAVEVMREVGIDIAGQQSKRLQPERLADMDVVVTVCDHAESQCPEVAGRCSRLHWPIDDPATAEGTDGERLAAFRRTRDELRSYIGGWLKGIADRQEPPGA